MRVGDTVAVTLKNAPGSMLSHSIDLHAVSGPGGGSVATNVAPGQTAAFTFKALQPGVYVYHCATAPVAEHISNGMYGLIVVEPAGGLPRVSREFYVMEGELCDPRDRRRQPYDLQAHSWRPHRGKHEALARLTRFAPARATGPLRSVRSAL